MIRTRTIIAAVLVALLATAGVAVATSASSASAARLAVVTKPEVKLTKLQRCAASMSGGVPVIKTESATSTTVSVKAVPAACAGLPMTVKLHDAAGAVLSQGTATAVTGTQTVAVGTYTAASVTHAFATIGGWVFPTTWTVPAVANGCVGLDAGGNVTAIPCTLTIGTVTTWQAGPYWYSQFQFSAQTTAPLWRVTFNFADTSKFQGFTPTVVMNAQNVALAPGYSCSQLPVFTGIEANPGWGSANGDITITNDPAASTQPGAICK